MRKCGFTIGNQGEKTGICISKPNKGNNNVNLNRIDKYKLQNLYSNNEVVNCIRVSHQLETSCPQQIFSNKCEKMVSKVRRSKSLSKLLGLECNKCGRRREKF